jgi:flavodoxin
LLKLNFSFGIKVKLVMHGISKAFITAMNVRILKSARVRMKSRSERTIMNVGVVVYSLTGNTFSVAEAVKSTLIKAGLSVRFETIKAKNEDPNASGPVELTQNPSVSDHQILILGGPVRGFSTAPIVKAYIEQLPDLNGKPVFLFVTHHFPLAFLGGNSALGMTRKLIEAKNGRVIGTGVVNWTSKHRSDNIATVCAAALSAVYSVA